MSLVSKNPLVDKIVSGTATPELLESLLSRQLPFTEEEYLESLAHLLKNDAVKDQASARLAQLAESVKENYAQKRDASQAVVYFLLTEALANHKTGILTAIIHNPCLPKEFLVKIGERGMAEVLEILIENQIRMIAYPEIMTAMEANPECSNFIKTRIKDTRDFYLQAQPSQEIPAADVLPTLTQVISDEEKQAREAAKAQEEEDVLLLEVEKKALTTLQRINQMSVSERVKLAITGTKVERMVLIKDSNKMVQLAVVESPKMSTDEVMIMVNDRSIDGEIISHLASDRDWTRNYSIMFSLTQNPKTPISKALGFIKQLHIRDLRLLSVDKNINPVVRGLAMNLFREKQQHTK